MEWKNGTNYFIVQGILVDTRFLIFNYDKMSDENKKLLVEAYTKYNLGAFAT